ncbi:MULTISPECIES: hypothetical protein [unclassified Saccharibacter]|uniref:hypothetical protein n=1 Tax=unclassified Saccharibacter TaxID=2648722 RepID=UPI0013272590|nr:MULTISPECIES: hypothetical protein [unclassified Saccharibacter]MXV35733.1 hypothetical protein [Saccharibacter sp. EH611]MXV58346.1 hypothetical protein [Saccharibacter sp. EH70]MXV65817.1 hypothetical protein [Saccharibacter sp. EH60]
MTKALTDISGTLSSFAGGAIDNWAIQRAARQWGIFSHPAQETTGFLKKVGNVLGDDVSNIFTKGPKKVLSAAHVEALEFAERSDISTAPQEEGNFVSYNKVFEPYTATIRFICDGSETGNIGENLLPGFVKGILGDGPDKVRRDFMTTLAALVKDTTLYYIATPERIYKHANIISYRVGRKAEGGVDMIVVDVQVQEVRQSKKTGWVKTKHPQGAQTQDAGNVQPKIEVGEIY